MNVRMETLQRLEERKYIKRKEKTTTPKSLYMLMVRVASILILHCHKL